MNKRLLAILSLTLCAHFSHAESISDALKTCGETQNSLKRLVCYDGIVQDMDKYSGLDDLMSIPAPLQQSSTKTLAPVAPASSSSPSAEVSSTESTENQDFGLEHKKLYDDTEDKIYATVAKVKKDAVGKLTITLDNGHVWKQIGTDKFRAKANEVVFIERGVLNSYMMGRDSSNKKTRVRRIN